MPMPELWERSERLLLPSPTLQPPARHGGEAACAPQSSEMNVSPTFQDDVSAGRPSARPLRRLRVVERHGPAPAGLSRVAVAFAGLLAAQCGAEVVRVEPPDGDPMRGWPPYRDGRSALFAFLTRGKTTVDAAWRAGAGDLLLTDDPAAAAAWPSTRRVLVRPGGDAGAAGLTELTVQARSGLLDIFAGEDGQPRPLPGNQIAYSAGMAAFDALLAGCLGERRGHAFPPMTVDVLDVALWVNWKHYLAAVAGDTAAGLSRVEEWTTLRCKDGHVALTFQDKDMASLATLTGNAYFVSPELATRKLRKRNVRALNEAIEAWTRDRTREEIVRGAQRLRIPVGPVLGMDELARDPQLRARAFFVAGETGLTVPRLPLFWNGAPLGRAGAAADVAREAAR